MPELQTALLITFDYLNKLCETFPHLLFKSSPQEFLSADILAISFIPCIFLRETHLRPRQLTHSLKHSQQQEI